jgi:hypothetical protein
MLLKRLKRWLGWDGGSSLLDFADLEPKAAPRSPVVKPPTSTKPPPQTGKPKEPERRAKPKRDPLDVLDNPRLTLDKPADDGFDPYNTGAFNRSASWERIGRQRKR